MAVARCFSPSSPWNGPSGCTATSSIRGFSSFKRRPVPIIVPVVPSPATKWVIRPSVWRQTDGRITHFVAGLGTTGTMMGTGRRLKELNPRIELVAVQPDGPFHGLEGLKHLATAIVPRIYDPGVPDRTEFVTTEEAEDAVRRLAKDAGLFVGWSAGAAVIAAERMLTALNRPRLPSAAFVVVIAPDSGTRYLSEQRR